MVTFPSVIVDLPRVDANIQRFHQAVTAAGCRVRAHLKAHRTVELAQRQVAAGAAGVAVHTASGAVRLANAGVNDVVLAWPWPEAWRFPIFAEAALQVPRFAVYIDRPESITVLGAAGAERGIEVGVRIDLRHAPAESVLDLARLAVDTPGIRFDGITGYCPTATDKEIRDRYDVGRRYAQSVVAIAASIRDLGLDCPAVSIGGVPTAAGASSVDGVTEICAGVYATFDGGLAEAGVCAPSDVAISVAADATELLDGCSQPWDPEVLWQPAAAPYADRLVPAHVCPLAANLLKHNVDITVVADGEQVAAWQPFAAPDRT
ncbi:alanine racemase [Catelliglobosispora koreensis]|uniref:alanine racemase n=1 Tax=Catelliglobosispora koreensis TaxID=129052 RepID=UPI00036EE942|nr:alanine racemase [Catelliglobosispora koreensis]